MVRAWQQTGSFLGIAFDSAEDNTYGSDAGNAEHGRLLWTFVAGDDEERDDRSSRMVCALA